MGNTASRIIFFGLSWRNTVKIVNIVFCPILKTNLVKILFIYIDKCPWLSPNWLLMYNVLKVVKVPLKVLNILLISWTLCKPFWKRKIQRKSWPWMSRARCDATLKGIWHPMLQKVNISDQEKTKHVLFYPQFPDAELYVTNTMFYHVPHWDHTFNQLGE